MNHLVASALMVMLAILPARAAAQLGGGAAESTSSPINYETARLDRIATALRISEEISLDGRLDEPAWAIALPATNFVQRAPFAGMPSAERTEVRFLYDESNLYVGFICSDSDPGRMVVNQLQEDYDFNVTDGVAVIIDSLHDRRTGFMFATNPAGARRDVQVVGNGQINLDWDGVWDVKVTRNDEGWIAEYRIPFKTLRFTDQTTQEWGVNLTRKLLRQNEESHWSPIPSRYSASRIDFAGTLTGLEDIQQGRNLRIKPYISAGTTQVREGDRLRTVQRLDRLTRNPVEGYDGGYDAGVDLKYSLTPSLILDATYHTDFAQAEVDQQQVNLTRFNLFFPEKRDFFLENTGSFTLGPGGNLVPFFSRRIGLSPTGTPIPIVGGARISGQLNRYNLGFLAMKTESSAPTPANTFLVGRLRRNLWTNSWIGGLFTHRDSSIAGDYNRVYGTDFHMEFSQKLGFDSYILRSDTPGRTGLNQARRFEVGWRDDELSIVTQYNAVQTNFNPEVGFIRRRDMEQYSNEFAWKPLLPSDTVRNLNVTASIDYIGGSGSGKVETRTQQLTTGIQFQSSAAVNFVVTNTFDRLANPLRIPSGNPRVSIGAGDYGYLGYSANFASNPRRAVNGNGSITWGEFYNGRQKAFTGAATFRPNHHFNLNLNYSRNQISAPNGSFTTNLVGTRFIYTFTPRAFFNAFIQYNTDTRQVSSNLRFNFTHHPLSDIYVVYNDTRDANTGDLVGRSLIIKYTNLFNF